LIITKILLVIACDKREAFAQGSEATKKSTFFVIDGLLRFARNDGFYLIPLLQLASQKKPSALVP
jgi:hypothetical protein